MISTPDASALLRAATEGNASPPSDCGFHGEDGGLGLPTDELMALGGDARITLDEQSGLNSYGCAPKPVPVIAYASSTASTVSAGAFAQARAFHFQLQRAAERAPAPRVYADAMEEARRRVRTLYGLDDATDIAFGPSGTDLEYLILALSGSDGTAVRNIVVEVDEVGSGCLNAQQGRYFARRTALGCEVETGIAIPGFDPDRIAIETVPVRNVDGSLRTESEREQALAASIEAAIAAGERPLLHTVHRSKTGLIAPRPERLDALARRFGDRIDIVVDACQGRISPPMIRAYLALGATVFITGSKFIGGPPFSAIALVPTAIGNRMRAGKAAEGLGAFFARGEMPRDWTAMDGVLPDMPNFGLLLRLECGLFELSRLLAYPDDVLNRAISAFARAVRALPANGPLRRLPDGSEENEERLHPLDRTMLQTFELTARHPANGRALDIDDAKSIYAMLYTDVSEHFSEPADRKIAAEACHVGQPVRCLRAEGGDWAPTLRLSLSAPQISEVAGLGADALLRRFETDIAWISAKIRLVLPLLPAEKSP